MQFVNGDSREQAWWARVKIAFLSAGFFLLVGSYTVVKELKNSVFMAVVGQEYLPWAKILAMFVLIPAVLVYAGLVDKLRRVQLLYAYAFFYGIAGIIFAVLMGHHSIGLPNTDSSGYRFYGWLFYFFVEGFNPFLIGVYWAFMNTINTPKQARRSYGLVVMGSKLGGIIITFVAWYFLKNACFWSESLAGDTVKHQLLMVGSSALVLLVPLVIWVMIRIIPKYFRRGYEAVYTVEKQRAKEEGPKKKSSTSGLFDGLWTIIKYPYVAGIFVTIGLYEVVTTVFSFHRLSVSKAMSTSMSEVTAFLLQQAGGTQVIGLVIALIGTHTLLRIFGERLCLLLVPVLTGVMLTLLAINSKFLFVSQASAVIFVYMGMQAVHYGFSSPLRESLYIPTVKSVKFKAKSWIDTFGAKFAKGAGSTFNMTTMAMTGFTLMAVQASFFSLIIGVWVVVAYLLGKKYDRTIANNEVIGD
jgi:ATP:ADP antiporter, AAA family